MRDDNHNNNNNHNHNAWGLARQTFRRPAGERSSAPGSSTIQSVRTANHMLTSRTDVFHVSLSGPHEGGKRKQHVCGGREAAGGVGEGMYLGTYPVAPGRLCS